MHCSCSPHVPYECITRKEKQLRIAKYYKAIIVHNLSYKLCSLREQNKNIKGYVEQTFYKHSIVLNLI